VGDPYDFTTIEWDGENERYVTVDPEREIAPEEKPETEPAHAQSDH
jgi:cytochrome c oxidase subunit 1